MLLICRLLADDNSLQQASCDVLDFEYTVLPRYIANICSGQILALKRGWQYNKVHV